MGMDADVICIGQFRKDLAQYLSYDPGEYYAVREGVAVVTELFCCNTTSQSGRLARVLGADPYDFNTHHIVVNKIDWDRLKEMCSRNPEWGDKQAQALECFLNAGFVCIYRPNY